MKTTLQIFLRSLACTLVCLIIFSSIQAKTLRVGYGGTALANVDYTSIDLAVEQAIDGDTLQIYGSQSGTVNKRLVIQGFGYNLDKHPNLQVVNSDQPSSATLTFQVGAENTVVEGLALTAFFYTGNIAIRRCQVSYGYFYTDTKDLPNIKFHSCVLQSISMQHQNLFNVVNLEIYNSILVGSINIYNTGSSGLIVNCVSANPQYTGLYPLQLYNAGFLVKNSILTYQSSNTNTVYEYNLFLNAQPSPLPLGSNNKWDQTFETVFNRLGGTDDVPGYLSGEPFDENYYILKAGSPAINAGKDGLNNNTNCGIFGGEAAYIYKIGGVPAIPAVYKLTAPSLNTSTNPYNITISVRSNN